MGSEERRYLISSFYQMLRGIEGLQGVQLGKKGGRRK